MIDGAVLASGGALEMAELPPDRRWTDLGAFERCVVRAAAALASGDGGGDMSADDVHIAGG
jgi:hypothetical protein